MQNQTLVVGLTGQTGAGKTTISKMFRDRKIPVVDADIAARDAIEKSTDCLTELVLAFSTEVIDKYGQLNRKRLGQICFGDREKLKRLNEITFPYIIRLILEMIDAEKRKGVPMVILDAPTLYESGLDKKCDHVVAVVADSELRAARIISRDRLSREDAMQRIGAQNDDAFYTGRADYIINNNRDFDDLRMEFIRVFGALEETITSNKPVGGELSSGQMPENGFIEGDEEDVQDDDPGAFAELMTELD